MEIVDCGTVDARWHGIRQLYSRPSPFANETGKLPNGFFEPSPELFGSIREDAKILVIGAGGLGCEILKNLALSGLKNLTVIDLDEIDISNLNRQFLFRMKDVNRPKAEVAAEFIMQRVPGCLVTPYYCRIQDFDEDFYRQFKLIVSGLDNIEARRWLNNMLVSMVTFDEDGDIDPDSIVPLLDGGTEGLKGQSRVIIPRVTSCFECTMDLFPPQKHFPVCTIASTPRQPEHCITYASMFEWPTAFPGRSINTDSPDDVQWVYHTALRRAEKFGISGVTYFLTLGVVKNVIPAVASTNAVIAASCANEAVKLLSFSAQSLNTYMMYMGSCGLYTDTFAYSKKDDCPVCGTAPPIKVSLSARTTTLQGLIDMLGEHPLCQMKGPFITSEAATLYAFNPPALKEALAPNLEKLMVELVRDDEILNVTDSRLNITVSIHVKFTDIP